MRDALVLGLAAALTLAAQAAPAAERGASPSPAAPRQAAPVQAGGSGSGVVPAKSLRDERALREAEIRDRRREERMLRVTGSICRGC